MLLALTVTPPANNTQPVKLCHQTDTSLDASEEGPAWVRPGTSNPRVVGIARMADPAGFIGYLRVNPFAHFFAGDCCAAAGIGAAGDLGDVINPDPGTDKMLAVQFSLGAITAPTTVPRAYGFSERAVYGGQRHGGCPGPWLHRGIARLRRGHADLRAVHERGLLRQRGAPAMTGCSAAARASTT